MNVRTYLETAFPKHCYKDRSQLNDLEGMPLDSNCGDDCKIAIDRAKAFDDLIRDAHGPYYETNHAKETQAISTIAMNLCLLYICG